MFSQVKAFLSEPDMLGKSMAILHQARKPSSSDNQSVITSTWASISRCKHGLQHEKTMIFSKSYHV